MIKRYILSLIVACNFIVAPQQTSFENRLVIVIPSYNNKQWYQQNLKSVFSQKYNNFCVVYIDDSSTDGTGTFVEQYLKDTKHSDRCTLIRNQERKGALYNLYRAIHERDDTDIIVTLDGDDWFYDEHVLEKINQAYKDPNVWLTYGQHIIHPNLQEGICRPYPLYVVQDNSYRSEEWRASHLRTFYAGLFKQIKLEHLLYKGAFLSVAWDLGFMLPMLEMANGKFKFIKEVLYVYNRMNPLNDNKLHENLQFYLETFIRSMAPYAPANYYAYKVKSSLKTSLIILSHDNPVGLDRLLAQVTTQLVGIDDIRVVYLPSLYSWRGIYGELERAYKTVKKKYPSVCFMTQEPNQRDSLRVALNSFSYELSNGYIALCTDRCRLKEPFDLRPCVKALEQTQPHAFYLNLSYNDVSPAGAFELFDGVYAWQFERCPLLLLKQNNLAMTIYKKETFERLIEADHYYCAENIQDLWIRKVNLASVGLCFKTAKIEQETI